MIPHPIDQADEPAALRGEVVLTHRPTTLRHYQMLARQSRPSTYRRVIEALREGQPINVAGGLLAVAFGVATVLSLIWLLAVIL